MGWQDREAVDWHGEVRKLGNEVGKARVGPDWEGLLQDRQRLLGFNSDRQ